MIYTISLEKKKFISLRLYLPPSLFFTFLHFCLPSSPFTTTKKKKKQVGNFFLSLWYEIKKKKIIIMVLERKKLWRKYSRFSIYIYIVMLLSSVLLYKQNFVSNMKSIGRYLKTHRICEFKKIKIVKERRHNWRILKDMGTYRSLRSNDHWC